jgi:cell division protein FtsQ
VVGDDAPKHMQELIQLIDATPSLKPEVVAAVRVGERRWNIRLKQGVTVMLPEDSAMTAWKKFVALAEADKLLSKAITSVDLRLEDRVFITPVAQPATPKLYTASARDT